MGYGKAQQPYCIIFIFLLSLVLLGVPGGNTQTTRITIPLGLEGSPTGSDSYVPYYRPVRPRIALALSGGGARGLAQIGVLKALERHGIPIDGIAGNSMGAIIGGLTCMGYTAAEIESLAYQIRWDQIIRDTPPRRQLFLGQKEERGRHIVQLRLKGLSWDIPSAYTAGQKLTDLITDLVLNAPYPHSTDFDDLAIPLRVLATDLLTGNKVVLQNGSLIQALRASMTIPLLFTPVKMNGALLVDGGLVQNLPVSEAKDMNADLVIAVDTSSKLREPHQLRAPWELADQVTTIMQQDQTRGQLALADISIQPHLENISNTAFDKIETLIQSGEEAAQQAIPAMERFFANDSEPSMTPAYRIKKVTLEGCINLDPESQLTRLALDTSNAVPQKEIVWAGQALYQSGCFQSVSAVLDTAAHHLQFLVEENPRIESIDVQGNRVFSDSALLACLESRPGEVINIHKGRQDLRRLINMYRDGGYALAAIDSIRIGGGALTIEIDEGVVDEIRLSGNDRTRPFVILRELPLKPGDLFNVSLLRQGIANIYSTGYFEGVHFDIQKKNRHHAVVLHLIERGYTLLRMGLRYDLERRTQGFVSGVEENLLGAGIKGSIIGLLGNRDRALRVRVWSDRLFKSLLTYRLDLSAERHLFDHYENHHHVGIYSKSHTWGAFTLGQQMRRLGTLSLTIRSEGFNLEPRQGDGVPNERYTLMNISLRSVVDTRDRMPFPRMGKYHFLEYETAGGFLGSDISYFKLSSSMETYIPLNDLFTLHPRICWGTSDLTIPFVKQFRMGGLNSFMGLPEEAFVGKRYVVINGELRCRIPWPHWLESYLSLRYDLGGIWGRYVRISTKDFKQGLGAVLSLNTPLGPIHVGYGTMSDGEQHAYFSAGYPF